MDASGIILADMPYPIASVYADLVNPASTPQMQREAIYLTGYQLMRTVALTLVGQYLSRDPLPDAPYQSRRKLNNAIAGVRSPHFNDWITLLDSLRAHAARLGIDFFPEFAGAMTRVKEETVEIPEIYARMFNAPAQRVRSLDALRILRNSVAHSGTGRDDFCREAVAAFRPVLDRLLDAFSFLASYELLALRLSLDDERPLVQLLKGEAPADAQEVDLGDELFRGFEFSPIVFRAPDGRVQGLFPFFHSHLEGEPLYCYDGHYLRDDRLMRRRTIYYLTKYERMAVDDEQSQKLIRPGAQPDAAEKLRAMLVRNEVPWTLDRQKITPWDLRDAVNDYARRTLDDVTGVKYLPQCYLDRPALGSVLRQFAAAETTHHRAMLLTGKAGSGKTALCCDLVHRLLQGNDEDLVFFVRGDGLTPEIAGANLLLGNLLHKIGIEPREFSTFAEFFAHLSARREGERVADRRFVIVLDAINEAPLAAQVLREALDMIDALRQHEWVRVVLTVREEFLLVWSRRRGELEASPFHGIRDLFVSPPDDPSHPRRPEDPPAWRVPVFTLAEAEEVYGRYQRAKSVGEAVPASLTKWERIPPQTKRDVLCTPLHLDLWMRAFDGREAPAVSGALDLFIQYLEDLRDRFDQMWESVALIIDRMLAIGQMELDDRDAHEIDDEWRARVGVDGARWHYSPLEVACASGLMQKRATEEGGGYRVTHQRMREVLIYLRLKERDQQLRRESIREWLRLASTEELEGALALIARDLWVGDRVEELAVWDTAVGREAIELMLSRRIEAREELEIFERRLGRFVHSWSAEGEALDWLASLLLFDVPEKLEGLPINRWLCVLWETIHNLLMMIVGQPEGGGGVGTLLSATTSLETCTEREERVSERWSTTRRGWRYGSGSTRQSRRGPTWRGMLLFRATAWQE